MNILSVEELTHSLRVRWSDQSASEFPYIFLRDNCPSGFHPQTQERLFDLLSVPPGIAAKSARLADAVITIDWDGHVSEFSEHWLAAHRPGRRSGDPAEISPESWNKSFLGSLPAFDAGEVGGIRPACLTG